MNYTVRYEQCFHAITICQVEIKWSDWQVFYVGRSAIVWLSDNLFPRASLKLARSQNKQQASKNIVVVFKTELLLKNVETVTYEQR